MLSDTKDTKAHPGKGCYGLLCLTILIVLLLRPCADVYAGTDHPTVRNGTIDLSGWSFERDGPVKLAGDWAFYWQQLLTDPAAAKPDLFLALPGGWNGKILTDGRKLPPFGYVTYTLRFTGLESVPNQHLMVYISAVNTAYRLLYRNATAQTATLLLQAGRVGTSRQTTIPQYKDGMVAIPYGQAGELILQISNFARKENVGLRGAVLLGTEEQIRDHVNRTMFFNYSAIGALFIIGLYQLVIFGLRRMEKASLWLGLFCITLAVYLTADIPFQPFFDSFWAVMKLKNLSYPATALFLEYLICLFPRQFLTKVMRVLQGINIGIFLVVLLTPPWIYTTISVYNTIVLAPLVIIVVLSLVIKEAVLRKDIQAWLILLGTMMIALSRLHFILLSYNLIQLPMLFHYGLFFFIFFNAMTIAVSNARARSASEDLSSRLKVEKLALEHSEDQVREMHNYLDTVFNSLSSLLISVNGRNAVTYWNASAEKFLGLEANDALGKPIWNVAPFLNGYRPLIEAVISTMLPDFLYRERIEALGRRYMNISITPLPFAGAVGAVIRLDDVTEVELKDQQLRQAQKMEMVGALAGGLAHDFNNILTGITGTVSLLTYTLKRGEIDPEKMQERYSLIERSAKRAAEMVQQLLAFSKKYELAFVPVDLNSAIKHVADLCTNTFDKSVAIRVAYAPQPAMVKADPAQIEEVMLNLCVNALHAMTIMRPDGHPHGGDLTIALTRLTADLPFQQGHPEAREIPYWTVAVRDTGVGMDDGTIAQIFEPFFTTKAKGSGLGLAMVYNIVKNHDGFIDVSSAPGIGTTFNLYLPVYEGLDTREARSEQTETLSHGQGLILVVDDEAVLRETTESILADCGYDVLTAGDGEEALRIFEARHQEIAAVILDLAMPRMSGKEVFFALKQINPRVKVLVSTGFKQDRRTHDILAGGGMDFIQKPFSAVELSQKIKNVIAATPGTRLPQ